jgi:uncharacterized membrane protein YbaN (DUF454 family)
MKKVKKYLFIILGSISLVLGSVGIILPLLPTTPFLLLSAFFYLKSSQRLYDWLLNHKIFGIYIYSYINYHAIDLKAKITSLSLLWITLVISMVLIEKLLVTVILIIIGLSVTFHLLTLKTMSKDEMVLKRRLTLSKE